MSAEYEDYDREYMVVINFRELGYRQWLVYKKVSHQGTVTEPTDSTLRELQVRYTGHRFRVGDQRIVLEIPSLDPRSSFQLSQQDIEWFRERPVIVNSIN